MPSFITQLFLKFIYSICTGFTSFPTIQEYLQKQQAHRRALLYAGAAANLIRMAFRTNTGNTVPSPLQLVMRKQLACQRYVSKRLWVFMNIIGLTLLKRKVTKTNGILDAAGMYQYLPWKLVPWGSVVHTIYDNCIYKRTTENAKGQYSQNMTSDVRRVITPDDLDAMGFYNHLEDGEIPRNRIDSDFDDAFPTTQSLAGTNENDFIPVDRAGEARINIAFEMYQYLNQKYNGISGLV